MFKFKSLSAKITISCIVSLIVINTIIVSVLTVNSNSIFNSLFMDEADISMHSLTTSLENESVNEKAICVTYAKKQSIISSFVDDNNVALVQSAYEIFDLTNADAIVYTKADGNVMYASSNSIDFSKMDCIKLALSGKENGSYQIFNKKQIYVAYSVPVYSGDAIVGSMTALYCITNPQFVDNLKKVTGSEFTILIDDVRISTTLMNKDTRQNGTKLKPEIANIILKDKKDFTGKADIFGKAYFTKYHPVMNDKGEILFTLFAGKSIESALGKTARGQLIAIGIAAVICTLAIVLLILLMNKMIKKPFKYILDVAKNIEAGEIGIANPDAVAISSNSNDEMGQISSALGETASSLQIYIGEISNVLTTISTGDLTVSTSGDYKGDFVGIKDALDHIITSLNQVMAKINDASDLLASRAEQISSASMALSQGSTEQASTVEELSATIQDISEKVSKSAEAANEANEISKKSSEEVNAGHKKMEEMLISMSDINSASGEIEKIIKTIDDIAFQTNILALNAAVEAARAGSAGKGFAVVADEVRNLASKSAEAAKHTTTLIQNTINLVENGTTIANSTADTFRSIIESTQESAKLIMHISEASNSQASAISQVTDGMQQISQVIQTTSATAQESAATSEELASQAHVLKNLVGMFKFKK